MANSKLVPEYILEIRESGTKKGQNPAFLNFIGATVAVSGNGLNVTITGGGGGVWGAITGTLADQTDLMTALNSKSEPGDNVSDFTNDAGYLTAMGSLDSLSDVVVPTPNDGDVLTYDGMSLTWIPVAPSAGGLTVGTCNEIPYVDVAGTDFCYKSGFNFNPTTNELEVWSCGTVDPAYNCHISRSGVIDTYFRSDGMAASCIFQVGFYDGETPHWGIRSCPSATAYTVNQYLDFTDYCTKWGNDDAYWLIGDTDNSMLGKFMCGFDLSHTSSSWSIDYCSMEPNRVRINKSYYLPECGPTTGQVLGYCSMTGQPEWITGGGGGGSSCGSDTWIQMADSFGGFAASCNFRYDYSFNYLEMRGNATCELLKLDHRSAGGGWVLDITNDTCGMGCDLTLRLGNDGMGSYRRFRIDNYCYADDWIDFSPYNHMMRVNYYDGMSCAVISEFGYDESNSATVMRNCCFGKFEIGECNIDRMKWTFATYNDYIKAEDCIVSYNGCCNFQWKFNNGCSNGWNEWLSSGPALGLVISSDDGCCLCPLVLAQGLVKRAEFDTSGMFVVSADTNLNGTNLCVLGNATFTGTFDTATNTQITIVNGIITGIV